MARTGVPDRVTRNTPLLNGLLVLASTIMASTLGYDSSMMNGLNILSSYKDYFHLTTATNGLLTASIYIGHIIASLMVGALCDRWGRKPVLYFSGYITLVGVALQTGAVHISMFLIGRIIVGFGTGLSGSAGPSYLAETTSYKFRPYALGSFFDCFFVGGLVASGVIYRTEKIDSTWSWRIPSLIQAFWSLISIAILPFVPESPRWLFYQGRSQEALTALAASHSNGDETNPVTLAQFQQIEDTLTYEKSLGKMPNLIQAFKGKSNRKRLLLALSTAVIAQLSANMIGYAANNVITYYLGDMLDAAGVTDATTQLEINVILNAFSLVVCIVGTALVDKIGRRRLALTVTSLLVVFVFLIGALTKIYGAGGSTSGIYATVAMIFLFQGCYAFGWTPLSVLYPPEVLSYSIRANGMGLYMFGLSGTILLVAMAFPIALERIGWKLYMINGAWDVLCVIFIYFYWVETKGKTLEEIDEAITGEKHTDVPDIDLFSRGEVSLEKGVIVGLEAHSVQQVVEKKA
ncbi:putative Lactose permease [Seiridium unicorne]|uniref:Lactose permease n=1 Tax=Seiridium unicorne TaxID=138068 RepID=A0ABR2VH42_9PEZI